MRPTGARSARLALPTKSALRQHVSAQASALTYPEHAVRINSKAGDICALRVAGFIAVCHRAVKRSGVQALTGGTLSPDTYGL
jgi:hypothetical protein